MHGVINRALQDFLTDTRGAAAWARIAARADLSPPEFEAMLIYDDALTGRVLTAAAQDLNRPQAQILEDMGTYLVTHPRLAGVRRVLRFGGPTFSDFLQSLNGLHGRLHLALPELEPPRLRVRRELRTSFSLTCRWDHPGMGHVLTGLLRAMADDYGALVLLDHRGTDGTTETIWIDLVDSDFARPQRFTLAGAGAG